MNRAVLFSAAIAVVCTLFSANANAREFADIYTDCGIGAMIAPNNEAVAAVTNVTWDSGTTAISSNISSPDTCRGGEAQTAELIYTAYPEIETAVAAGRGESLDALYGMVGCSEPSRAALTQSLRHGFADVVGQDGYDIQSRKQKAEQFYNLFHQTIDNQAAPNACAKIS